MKKMETAKYITVLDFVDGRVYQYEIGESEGASTGRNRFFNFVKDNNISDIIILNGFIGKKNQPVEKIVKINYIFDKSI